MNCYIVFLRPFSPEERGSEKSKKCEQNSIKNNICGMGWNVDSTLWKQGFNSIGDNNVKYHSADLGKGWKTSVNIYKAMKPGDYVLTRDYDGICYVGKVNSKAYHEDGKYCFDNYDNYSWIVDVEWKKMGEFINLPSGLRGLMSGRLNTAKRVKSDVHKG